MAEKYAVYNPEQTGGQPSRFATASEIVAEGGGGGGIQSIVAGDNISVDNTDPQNPIVAANAGVDMDFTAVDSTTWAATGNNSDGLKNKLVFNDSNGTAMRPIGATLLDVLDKGNGAGSIGISSLGAIDFDDGNAGVGKIQCVDPVLSISANANGSNSLTLERDGNAQAVSFQVVGNSVTTKIGRNDPDGRNELAIKTADSSVLAPLAVADPTEESHAATKGYVDGLIGGVSPSSSNAENTSVITQTGDTNWQDLTSLSLTLDQGGRAAIFFFTGTLGGTGGNEVRLRIFDGTNTLGQIAPAPANSTQQAISFHGYAAATSGSKTYKVQAQANTGVGINIIGSVGTKSALTCILL